LFIFLGNWQENSLPRVHISKLFTASWNEFEDDWFVEFHGIWAEFVKKDPNSRCNHYKLDKVLVGGVAGS
jgi:hypothetical protein